MIGERIKRARVAAGLSMREAGNSAQLSAMAISKFERGESTPTSKSLIQLARALNTPIEFFFRPDTVTLGEVEYRKRASIGKKHLARIEADILDQVERFLELLLLFPNSPMKDFEIPVKLSKPIASMDDVEQIASDVRDAWCLGMDGIPNMSDVLEDHGIFVITTDVDDRDEFDGLTAWVNERPVIVVGSQWPGDRQRFTLAHELGHLIIGEHLADGLDKEKACHRFAGAFLVPKNTMIAELGAFRNRIEPRELYQLKREYGLSMYALIFRAKDTGVITEVTADILMRTFSSNGWRKMEPWESIPSERPHLFEQLVMHALAEDMVSTSKAAELMSLPLNDFRSRLAPESHNVAAHQ